jgi:hypothetical protein
MGSFVSLGALPAILQQQMEIYIEIKHMVHCYSKFTKHENLYERCLDSMSLLFKLNDSMHLGIERCIDVQYPFDYLDALNLMNLRYKWKTYKSV